MPNQPSQVPAGKTVHAQFFPRDGHGRFFDDERNINQPWIFRAARAGDGAVAFQFVRQKSGSRRKRFCHPEILAMSASSRYGETGWPRNKWSPRHEQNHFARRKIFRLKNRVAVAFLLVLHGKT